MGNHCHAAAEEHVGAHVSRLEILVQMREYFEAVKGVRPDDPLSADVQRHAAEVLFDDLHVSPDSLKYL